MVEQGKVESSEAVAKDGAVSKTEEKAESKPSKPEIDVRSYLRPYEAAKRLGYADEVFARYIREGKVAVTKIGHRYYIDPHKLPEIQAALSTRKPRTETTSPLVGKTMLAKKGEEKTQEKKAEPKSHEKPWWADMQFMVTEEEK